MKLVSNVHTDLNGMMRNFADSLLHEIPNLYVGIAYHIHCIPSSSVKSVFAEKSSYFRGPIVQVLNPLGGPSKAFNTHCHSVTGSGDFNGQVLLLNVVTGVFYSTTGSQ